MVTAAELAEQARQRIADVNRTLMEYKELADRCAEAALELEIVSRFSCFEKAPLRHSPVVAGRQRTVTCPFRAGVWCRPVTSLAGPHPARGGAKVCPLWRCLMAQRTVFVEGIEVGWPYIFNVGQPVGKRITSYTKWTTPDGKTYEKETWNQLPNVIDDVMLVQWLFKHSYVKGNPEAGTMVVDGFCGPQTLRWIARFQLQTRKGHYSINPDGCVDPARGAAGSISHGSITHTLYTIVHLNSMLRGARPDLFADPSKDKAIPAILLAKIK
jgi:hypothetical protein